MSKNSGYDKVIRMSVKPPFLYNIFKDAYGFFDKRWLAITLAAIFSIGAADIAVYIIKTLVPLGSLDLKESMGLESRLENYVLLEAAAVFFAGIWFRGFVAVLADSELKGEPASVAAQFVKASALYPRVFALNLAAIFITYFSAAVGMLMLSASVFGAIFLLPALLYSVWFSLVSPVVVMDSTRGILAGLRRSKSLVRGYFVQVLFLMFIVVTPTFAMVGLDEKSTMFWPVLIFINVATSILDALLITFAYINLRTVKNEGLSTATIID